MRKQEKNEMKVRKWICLGMAIVLVCSNMPGNIVSAQEVQEEKKGASWETFEYEELEDGTVEITKYNGKAEQVAIPEKINGKKVTRIGDYAFGKCRGILGVKVPESVTRIGDFAFEECYELQNINLPETLTEVGMGAFIGCDLKTIKIPGGLTELKERTFLGCALLKTIEIPQNIAVIGSAAFQECHGLKKVTISPGVKKIEYSAFYSCESLERITIPNSVEEIGVWVFSGCSSLMQILVGTGNRFYASAEGALYSKDKTIFVAGPGGKEEVEILPGVTKIEDYAFERRTKLTKVTIPSSVEWFGSEVFRECNELRELVIPGSLESIPYNTFDSCSNLTAVRLEQGVKSIGSRAFNFCYRLRGISIPESVTEISTDAFRGCNELTIYGIDGSYAQTYAEENNIPFVAEGMPEFRFLSDCTITLSQTSYIYDGKEKKPAVTVKDQERTLKEGEDYTVAYENNTWAGTARVIVTGKGNYAGKKQVTFAIVEESKPISKKEAQILACSREYKKACGNKSFSIAVKLKKGDGKLSYVSSDQRVVNVDGTGKVTVRGTGIARITITAGETAKYKKTQVKVTVKVCPAKQKLKSVKSVKGKKLNVIWKKDPAVTGYQIRCSTDKNFKKNLKIVTVKNSKITKTTISKLIRGKRYYVSVCAYKNIKVNGKVQKLSGAWSKAKRSGKVKK